jgi:hypothetical protein
MPEYGIVNNEICREKEDFKLILRTCFVIDCTVITNDTSIYFQVCPCTVSVYSCKTDRLET